MLNPDSSQSISCNGAPLPVPGSPATSIHLLDNPFLINELLENLHFEKT